jgi:tetratricopeptide (TPR) repeat protein
VAGRGPAAALPESRTPRPKPGQAQIAAAVGVGLAALVLAWAVWQPEGSDRATGQALELADQGSFPEAIAKTEDAEDTNPLTPEPLLVRASIQTQAGDEAAAEETLERAVLSFPGDPQTWYRLAAFQLGTRDRPAGALETLQGALYLDPFWNSARALFLEARARQRELETLRAQRRQQQP